MRLWLPIMVIFITDYGCTFVCKYVVAQTICRRDIGQTVIGYTAGVSNGR